jgi:hypothetical protein
MTGSGCNSEEFRQFFYMSCLDCSLKHVFERVGPIASAPDRRTKIYRPVHGQGFKRARHTFFKLINRFINKYRAIFTTVYKLNLYSLFKWTKKTLGHENWCEHENINEPKRNLEVLKIRNVQINCSYRMKGLSGSIEHVITSRDHYCLKPLICHSFCHSSVTHFYHSSVLGNLPQMLDVLSLAGMN